MITASRCLKLLLSRKRDHGGLCQQSWPTTRAKSSKHMSRHVFSQHMCKNLQVLQLQHGLEQTSKQLPIRLESWRSQLKPGARSKQHLKLSYNNNTAGAMQDDKEETMEVKLTWQRSARWFQCHCFDFSKTQVSTSAAFAFVILPLKCWHFS